MLHFVYLQLNVPVHVNASVISSAFRVFVNQPVGQMTAVLLSSFARTAFVCRKCDVEQIMSAVTQRNAERMLWVKQNV
jgi:hypothetical protein